MAATILIVEDEPPQAEMLSYNLAKEGYSVLMAENGDQAFDLLIDEHPDLIVLDWMLPDISGIEICRRLRARTETKSVPIILLTARGEEEDRVRGIETGADDYVVKPYSPRELIARIKGLLRRSHPELSQNVLEYADLSMDLERHKVTRAGKRLHLGPTEFRLLRVFLERPTRVLSREALLDLVWGRDVFVEDRTVDVHIRRLRKIINADGGPDLIRTVRGAGYALEESDL
jgi:two-component system phosphate regulon response regulator PhoB